MCLDIAAGLKYWTSLATTLLSFGTPSCRLYTILYTDVRTGMQSIPVTTIVLQFYQYKPYYRAKYSRDYDGWRMLLHHRFYGANGDNVGDWAHDSSPAGGDGIMERGFWPSKPDEWQECSVTIKLRKPATTMLWYLGYPLKSTAGSLSFTGMSMVRLGGDGSC